MPKADLSFLFNAVNASVSCHATSQELACLFPYLDKSGEYLYSRGFTLENVLASEAAVERAIQIVEGSLRRGKPAPCVSSQELEAAAARLAVYIVAASANSYVLRRFADSQSKIFTFRVRNTPGIQSFECKAEIAADLGIETALTHDIIKGSILAVTHPLAIRWIYYVKYAPQDPDWSMINRPVVKGWVLLRIDDFERILEEAYEARILRLASREDVGYIAGVLGKMDKISALLERLRSYRPIAARAAPAGETPPCMASILESLKRGENLPHVARFAITAYLLRQGWDVDRIVDLFRSAPDFNERITRYQVQHIAGQAGGRKEYSVPSCETMNSWGLCPTNLGCGVKNPVQYGRRRDSATVKENRA
jgi:DNA primase large subunit